MKKNLFLFFSGVLVTLIIVVFTVAPSIRFVAFQKMIVSKYDGEVDERAMTESILAGITDGLGDEHSIYFPPVANDKFLQTLQTNHEGIGVRYDAGDDMMQIMDIVENSPASQVDLYPGDIIKEINGTVIDQSNITNPMQYFTYDAEDELLVLRPSTGEEFTVSVEPGDFTTPTVSYDLFDQVGYIKIDTFADNTDDEFEAALTELESKNITRLIIDVRDNGGGSLDTVENIIDLIINDDRPYLYTKKGDEVLETETSSLEEPKPYDVVAIQNGGSASASEILTGAIQQVNGGAVIGQTSYGKGSVQTLFNLAGNFGAVKVTIAHWYTADDTNIDEVGITPDIEIAETSFDYISTNPIVLDQDLTLGDSNVQMMKVNNFLSILGYETSYNSVNFDQTTLDAVKAFQADYNLEVTGIVDYKTAYALSLAAFDNIHKPEIDPYIKAAMNA